MKTSAAITIYLTALTAVFLCTGTAQATKKKSSGRSMQTESVELSSPQETGRYRTQSSIDSLYSSALYGFQSAINVNSMEMQQRQAIARAKNIVEQLKQMANDNRNRNYILWKASELEGQIILEEDDLFMRSSRKDINLINKLVDQVNVEISRRRTDLIRCQAIALQMESQSSAKAREIGEVIERRGKVISHEILGSAEKFLAMSDIDMAYQELKYCERNRRFLSIDQSKYNNLKARVEARDLADQDRYYIDTAVVAAHINLGKLRLKEARMSITESRARMDRIESVLPRDLAVESHRLVDSVVARYDQIEDSLVAVNFEIVQKKGTDAALDHKKRVLEKYGLSREKMDLVDNAVLYATPLAARKKSAADTLCNAVIAMAEQADDGSNALSDMMAQARRRAKAKADSSAQAEVAARAHEDSVAQIYASMSPAKVAENMKKAQVVQGEIYAMLNKKDIPRAVETLNQKKRELSIYLYKESFDALCRSVEQNKAALRTTKK